MESEFEELSKDAEFVSRIQQFRESLNGIDEIINVVKDPSTYNGLSNIDKIQYNLLMSYSLNSLFWMYLRLEGIDPMKHQIKSENNRLKTAMVRAKQINDRNTIMPRVNRDVAQRFVRSSLWEPRGNEENNEKDKTG